MTDTAAQPTRALMNLLRPTAGKGRRSKARPSRSIIDAAWGEPLRQLRYTCAWYGRMAVIVDRFFPSTGRVQPAGAWEQEVLKSARDQKSGALPPHAQGQQCAAPPQSPSAVHTAAQLGDIPPQRTTDRSEIAR